MSVQLPGPVARVVDAINAGDTEAFVTAFAADGAVDDWGRVLEGPEGVRNWADSDAIGAGARMTVLSADTDGDTTHLRFDWRSRVFNGESEAFVTVAGDEVKQFRIPPA
ncbi:nuclear transport factor 2 family protein [Nocardia flavorosea]|uniref:Nuclear transport factor 2 family protein n=1 Tax=Nocardia flavorosea TaxID=53429 RepID=A0A846YGU3_9NOCA|nr:nuclear transport factor 2 family protein [Nocardia flavorosea]NKY58005.1 nuclear transport factor 2 family protein [Nocardia flavorosea]